MAKTAFVVSVFFLFVASLFAQTATPTPLPGTGDGAAATFYSNTDLTGTVVAAYYEGIGGYFGNCAPDPSIPASAFSGIYTAQLEPVYSEPYTFSALVQGAVRVMVNGVTVINQWANSPVTAFYFSGPVTLTALQRVPLEVDYFKTTSPAQVELFWQSGSQAMQAPPMNRLYSGLTHPPTPPPQVLQASYTSGLTVDGSVTAGAWSSGSWTPMHTAWGENLGINGEFQAKWDNQYLYLGCRVYNLTPHHDEPEDYNDDSIELYLDTTNHRSPGNQAGDFQYFLDWGTNTIAEYVNNSTAGVLGWTVNTPYGYSGVLAIPWGTLGVSPTAGKSFGMDVGVNLAPQPGCLLSKLRWNGNLLDSGDTRPYGVLTLGAAPPALGPSQTPFFYPEPASGDFVNLAYDMREAGEMKLKVWNAAGNLVATLDERKGAGNQISYLPISSFAPGHYFYQVTLVYDSGNEDNFKTRVLPIQK